MALSHFFHRVSRAIFPASALFLTATLGAQITIVDRGLPTANLNEAAGANRSNVAWRYGASVPGYAGVVVGDDFNVGNPFGGSDVTVTALSLWVMQSAESAFDTFNYTTPASYSLLLGDETGTLFPQSAAPLAITTVTYANGGGYETTGGTFVNLLRLDFSLNFTVAADSYVFFGLGGYDTNGGFLNPYVHASNGPLSGSPQQGSDDLLSLFGAPVSTQSYFEYGGDYDTAGTVWDKSSSLNVIVSAQGPVSTAVPEPSTYGLMGAGLLAVFCFRASKQKKRIASVTRPLSN